MPIDCWYQWLILLDRLEYGRLVGNWSCTRGTDGYARYVFPWKEGSMMKDFIGGVFASMTVIGILSLLGWLFHTVWSAAGVGGILLTLGIICAICGIPALLNRLDDMFCSVDDD